ncbi:MAG TPA: tetratricopeptide repeat protein [Candidatus Saccharimonadales bacterium]|nr:tetratricopeptide repeat protein [Candidatus Saccharimonadales bacterium]
MKNSFPFLVCQIEKRRKTAAVQNAGAFASAAVLREASWTAPALWRFGVLLFVLVIAGKVFAADVTADFNAANKLYAEGKFSTAAAAYEKILQSDAVSAPLYFNYGNAEYKLGHLGRAIAAYRQAELLAPRDDEVRANLDFVRKQVAGPTWSESRWEDWLGTLTLDQWALLAAGIFWLTFILFTARQIRPAWRSRLRGLTSTVVVLTILTCAGLGAAAVIHFTQSTAVVVESEATARSGPFDEAQDVFKASDGTELAVLNRRDNWLQISDGSGRIGWLPAKKVEVLPGV